MTQTVAPPAGPGVAQRTLAGALRSRELAIAAVLVAVIVATTLKSHSFVFSHDGWRDLLLSPSLLLLLAIGEMVVVVTRNVDLSVGSRLRPPAELPGAVFR